MKHILQFKDALLKRNKDETEIRYEWYVLQRCAATYYPEFEKEKVIYPNMSMELKATYDKENFFCNQKAFIITGSNLKYITALFNSKIEFWYFKKIGATLGSSGYEMSKIFIEKLPFPPITSLNQSTVSYIENLVDQITNAKKQNKDADTSQWEQEIDNLVYKLYDLTPDEIKIIENDI